jgi:hypothetical protein
MLPAPLPDLDGLDPETLKALLIAKHNESLQQHKQLKSNTQEIEHLKLVIEKYRRMIFGRKSEKLTRELEQFELRLEELETTQARDQAVEAEQPDSTDTKTRRSPSRPRRKPLPEDLPREIITHTARARVLSRLRRPVAAVRRRCLRTTGAHSGNV